MSDEEAAQKKIKRKRQNSEEEGGHRKKKAHQSVDMNSHPSYKNMVIEALEEIGDEANFTDVLKHISTYYSLGSTQKSIRFNLVNAITKLIESGIIGHEGSKKISKSHIYGTLRLNEEAAFATKLGKPLKRERTPERELPGRAARNKPVQRENPYNLKPTKTSRVPTELPSDDSDADADYNPKKALPKLDRMGRRKRD